MRILLTGASGFVGRWTVAALAKHKVEVFALSRKPVPAQKNVYPLALSVLDGQQIRQVFDDVRATCVVHLAWDVSHGSFYTASTNLDWAAGSINLYRYAVEAGATRFVGIGSCAEYAPEPGTDCDEQTSAISPTSLYGIAKDAVRRVTSAHAQTNGVSFVWARLFHLFGPGEPPERLVPSVCLQLARGLGAPISSGNDIRDYMDVRDAAEALGRLVLSDVTGEINIGSGHGISVAEVAHSLESIAGRPGLLQRGVLPDRTSEQPRLVANTKRLNKEVGFTLSRPLRDRLAETYRMWEALSEQTI
ncbi:NAD(P)-dependent oxidoreductase [Bradyrhizobium sp. 138]|uniref:NAD-dependent epimerase/dehydratase family protein n=1 Tax=Bradyrhizobium sp. 138 TaxID=2782615 RepID=UPI00211188DB|nr:NAD(P)-dependent oxidoreductase [Bradyrhizobium sp. 138]MCK1737081.1 NAD(P)-dependent oxidoreductase [Bradyrhizobium sp. 138]